MESSDMRQAGLSAAVVLVFISAIGYAVYLAHQQVTDEGIELAQRCNERGLMPRWAGEIEFCMDPRTRALFAP